jgi:2-keto-4-pentenoate hydratase
MTDEIQFYTSPDPPGANACIDWIAHGIEIVQSHFPGWKFQAADTIADWALHGRSFLGSLLTGGADRKCSTISGSMRGSVNRLREQVPRELGRYMTVVS